jgi:hypothetical protein
MSLHTAAKHLAAQGRGKDKMLVHMTPNEVKGLRQIARTKGGDLSINPETGLVEAGFLEDILPMVAAGAAIYFTGGLAASALAPSLGATTAGILGGAGAGALIGGGMAALQGGDFGKGALMGAIGGGISGGMGGLYTPGGETAALTAGAATPPPVDVNAPVMANAAQTNLPVQTANITTATPTPVNPSTGAPIDVNAGMVQASAPTTPSVPSGTERTIWSDIAGKEVGAGYPSAPNYPQVAPGGPTPAPAPAPSPTAPTPKAPGMSMAQKVLVGGTGLMALGALDDRKKYGVPAQEDYNSPLQRISPDFRAQQPIQPDPYYRARYPTYAAEGGKMEENVASYAGDQGSQVKKKKKPEYTSEAKIAASSPYEAGIARFENEMYGAQMPTGVAEGLKPRMKLGQLNLAKGGQSNLGDYSDGGRLLKGPGDGVSDSIPAVIGRKQPARLADGEFVVPARIVSELGNGSTDAGAKKLYGMMDRIQKKRRAAKGIATDTKVDKYLPA